MNVAFASRQLGHAVVSTTLNVYTDLFDHAEHAASVTGRLEGRFGETLRPAEQHPTVGGRPARPPGLSLIANELES